MYENENQEVNKEVNPEVSQEVNQEQKSPYFDYIANPVNQRELIQEANSTGKTVIKKAKKKGGGVKKFVTAITLGLLFGGFAAAGFRAVDMAADHFFPKAQEEQIPVVKDVMTVIDETNIAQNGNAATKYVTYVQNDISNVVDNVMPAMVSIVNNYTTNSYNFWGQSITRNNMASGSGIIVGQTDKELLIATNNHVIEAADKIEVTFIDGSKVGGVTKGTDPDMDLAVVAVPIVDIPAETKEAIAVAKLGDSDSLKLGEPVIAIGNALGYGQSVTTGIVSALDRVIDEDADSENTFIQTDAAINPGNSGGALLNIDGEVIGINSSKMGGTSIEGMGYAIPISHASPILEELMTREIREKVDEAEIGYLGIGMQGITEDIEQSLGLPKGIYVKEVQENSAAEKAGLQKRDIIVKFNGQKVTSPTDLKEKIEYYRAGDEITLTIQRAVNGEYETLEIPVTLGKKPAVIE